MKFNEKKLVEFLEKHIGENYVILDLMKESGACEEDNGEKMEDDKIDIDFVINERVRKIAAENGFCFNSHHHDNTLWGMPWVYDFYIELEDAEKDIARINAAGKPWKKKDLIEEEYGIWDEFGTLVIGFRTTIPARIKELYDQICEEIEGPENRD